MTPPKRPPAKPKPIGLHPHAGQLAVVVSFRVEEPLDPERAKSSLERTLPHVWGWEMHDLTVHVRVLGAGGEASEFEGVAGPLAHTEDDLPTIRTTRDQDNVETRGRT